MKHLSDNNINQLRQNARSMVRELGLLKDAYYDIDVTLAERHFLIELSSSLFPTVGDIAELLLLDKSTASRLIAKTVKKGYVKYSSDEHDKRKRFLMLTEKGKEILSSFETIALNQTKEALFTLTPEEIDTVYKGVALYAQGLKNSRLRNNVSFTPIAPQNDPVIVRMLAKSQHNKITNECLNLFETYQQKGSLYSVMKLDSKIIGGAGISPYDQTYCQLEFICLQNQKHYLEFEKLLIDSCMKEAKKLGYSKCYVDLIKENLLSKEFFLKQGFQPIKKINQKSDYGKLVRDL